MLGLYVKHAYKHAYKACLGLGWWGQVGWLVTTSRYKQAQASKHAKYPPVLDCITKARDLHPSYFLHRIFLAFTITSSPS